MSEPRSDRDTPKLEEDWVLSTGLKHPIPWSAPLRRLDGIPPNLTGYLI